MGRLPVTFTKSGMTPCLTLNPALQSYLLSSHLMKATTSLYRLCPFAVPSAACASRRQNSRGADPLLLWVLAKRESSGHSINPPDLLGQLRSGIAGIC